jgi:hypothetical protein
MLLTTLIVSGCATSGPVRDFCLIAEPIYFHPDDKVTARTETAIIKHNERGSTICAW